MNTKYLLKLCYSKLVMLSISALSVLIMIRTDNVD